MTLHLEHGTPVDDTAPDGRRRLQLLVDRAFVASTLVLIATVPIESAFSYGPISLARISAAAALVFLVGRLLAGVPLTVDRPAMAAILALASWAVLSYFWSRAPMPTLVYASTLVQLGLLVLIVWQLCTTPARMRLGVAALSLGGLVGAVLGIRTRVAAHGGVPRYAVGDPNDFGLFLTVTTLATVHLALTSRRLLTRLVLAASTALQLVAIVRTASRTALVALVVGLLVLGLHRASLRPKALLGGAAVAVVVAFLATRVTDVLAFSRLEGVTTAVRSGDFNNRTDIWTTAASYWDASPIGGIGGGAFHVVSASTGKGTAAHSVLFGVLAELGLVGLLLFGVLFVVSTHHALGARSHSVRRFLLAAAAAWACGALTLTLEDRKITWLLVAFATCEALRRPRRRTGLRDV